MKAKLLIIALLGYWVIGLSGCVSTVKKEEGSAKAPALLEPSNISKFTDVPVPSRFKFLEADSYSFESAGIRVGFLRYRGKANAEQVVSFYREQMPMYNWNLLNVVEYGDRLMNFDREAETCIITITPKGSAALITVSVGPKNQPAGKKSAKALK
ncbi:MAG: hypothetical protein Q8N85_05900 [Candidatus Omnitrophota bacterium]|nr:hypothetical protein [Candidatus Omnitrophota bacterium]